MDKDDSAVDHRASEAALAFGSLIRGRRKALKMRQDQLALATGVGRRFLIELEAGKPTCQLGRSLLVADALGLKPTDIQSSGASPLPATVAELPDPPEEEEPDVWSTRIL
jgi:transcriptional regulator with XRE-family HTH domain